MLLNTQEEAEEEEDDDDEARDAIAAATVEPFLLRRSFLHCREECC
jgi:hypothetical protein